MKGFFGEVIGTFVLVFIGCSAVAAAVVFHWLNALWQVAFFWSIAVFLGILTSRKFSQSHLNPAVTMALLSVNHFKGKASITTYLTGQFIGAFLAAALLYCWVTLLDGFNTVPTMTSAMIFGEYYPNPTLQESLEVPIWKGAVAEAIGTFVLVWVIFETGRWKIEEQWLKPALIGLTVGLIIMFVADYTQAGLNPARDFGPRLFSYLAEWGEIAFSQGKGTFLVYIFAPIIGGVIAAKMHTSIWKG